jgi:FtsP/CotA-like multicopper oxidase with cupredoxin domain
MKVLVFIGGLVLIAVLLLIRAQRRSERLALPGARLRATGRIWLLRLGSTVVVVAVAMTLFTLGLNASRFPDSFSMMSGGPDYGGGEPIASGHAGGRHPSSQPIHFGQAADTSTGVAHGSSLDAGAVSVTELRGPKAGTPDRAFTLTAQETQVRLSSGATVNALTYNGQAPGPELRVKKGDLVEVKLVNKLPSAPVTIHWHGVDVPNGEDGVAGVTQDAVKPGQSYTYRFKVDESGTRWYHSHQDGNEQVGRGLFGPMVIEDGKSTVDQDLSLVLHNWETDQGTMAAIGTADTLQHKQIAAGQKVRLRLVNSGNTAKTITLTGVPYRVTALDGTAVNAPGELRDNQLVLGGSGRYDLEFTMPTTPVRLVDAEAPDAGMLFSNDGKGDLAPVLNGPEFDPTTYGQPARTPFTADSHYDRSFELKLDQQFGFYNGEFTARMTVNGKVFPDAPMQMVREGDLVRMKLINRGDEDHPIHLHGHHFLVLSKNGNRTTGSPMWLDTVNVRPGEIWEIGFRADNPGVWMDHCHNFRHAQLGMVFHLAYENVTTPFLVGGAAGNQPE